MGQRAPSPQLATRKTSSPSSSKPTSPVPSHRFSVSDRLFGQETCSSQNKRKGDPHSRRQSQEREEWNLKVDKVSKKPLLASDSVLGRAAPNEGVDEWAGQLRGGYRECRAERQPHQTSVETTTSASHPADSKAILNALEEMNAKIDGNAGV